MKTSEILNLKISLTLCSIIFMVVVLVSAIVGFTAQYYNNIYNPSASWSIHIFVTSIFGLLTFIATNILLYSIEKRNN